jgi:hypothetical protein
MRPSEGQRWESNPRESPLYEELPNTDCDEHGVLHCKPYWNTAKKRIFKENEKYCEVCGGIREHYNNICIECNTAFTFQPVRGIVH